MNRNIRLALFLPLLMTVSGCATYKTQIVNTERVESYKNKITVSGITVAADPYDTADRAKSAFYIDLTKKNIKPIQLVVDNQSEDNVMIPRGEMRLMDSNGTEYQPVNSNYVYGKFEKNELAYAFWGFGIFSYMSAQEANDKMKADWYEKEFPEERTIITKRKSSGFVFFELGPHLKGMKLSVNALNLKTNQYTKIEVPID